jgi:GNAT superfamily N-acetyltransferase
MTTQKYSLKRTLLENTLSPAEQMVDELLTQFPQPIPRSARIPRFDIEIMMNHGECLSILTMEIDGPNQIWLNNLYTTDLRGRQSSHCYRKGYGKKMMQALTQAADTHGITLELIAAPPPAMRRQDPTLPSADELAKFYAGHGFYETSRNSAQVYMRRDPA